MTQMSDAFGTARKMGHFIWYLICSPFAWPIFLTGLTFSPTTLFFTEMEFYATTFVSFGIALIMSLFTFYGWRDPSLIFQLLGIFGIKYTIICSTCFAVRFALTSVLLWSLIISFSPTLQEGLQEECVEFCSLSGGNKIWGVGSITILPMTELSLLAVYSPLLTFVVVYMWTIVSGLWQAHELGIEFDEWAQQWTAESKGAMPA